MEIRTLEHEFDGTRCVIRVLTFGESDRARIRELYSMWRTLSDGLRNFHDRRVNIPPGISESAFCLEYNAGRTVNVTGGASSSFDTIDLTTFRRQQIKATSVENDLTSFGPRSVWDDLYWLDFYRDGAFDGQFDVYKIPDELIYGYQINANQTFADQQQQIRRPRLCIRRNIIRAHNIIPERTCRI